MAYSCREVDERFLDSAPLKFVNEVVIDATPGQTFDVLEDGDSWPKWFKDIVKVEWTSSKPFGVGTTRTVTLKTMTVYEKFFIWESGRRFAFFFTEMSLPLASAFCEDYRLEAIGDGKTRFTYIVACEPRLMLKLLGPIGKWVFGSMFRKGAQSLAAFMKEKSTQ